MSRRREALMTKFESLQCPDVFYSSIVKVYILSLVLAVTKSGHSVLLMASVAF